jgi:sarcosine oxidase
VSDKLPSTNPALAQATVDELEMDSSVPTRRDFLKIAGAGTSAFLAASCVSNSALTPVSGLTVNRKPSGGDVGHVVIVGAGAWGSWTSYHLRQRGVRVTLIDQYGAGNSRSTSGDETRGVRSSYGDRTTVALWSKWARAAIVRWGEFDKEWAPVFRTRFFMTTGDVIMRATDEPFLKLTREQWAKDGVPHEVLDGAEVRKRWPVIKADDITIAITEPDAGVVRARASTQAVAAISQKMGTQFVLGRVRPGPIVNGKMDGVVMDDGTVIRGDQYVFACGPWLQKMFPELMKNRMRIPLGYVMYYGTPVGDTRFTYPNLPSFNFPGVTGWPVLPTDSRGFRVRGAVAAPIPVATTTASNIPAAVTPAAATAPVDPAQNDPDLSTRWANQDRLDGTRRFVQQRFPALANAPLLETRSCHYEQSINRDFIVDHVPGVSNAWIAGVGQAEGFKFSPIVGEYVAQRVMGIDGDPALVKAFKMPTEEYALPTPTKPGEETS